MYTQRLEGIPAALDDAAVARALELQEYCPESGYRECRIGIAGPDGKVYRTAVARGVGELAGADRLLKDMGFEEGPPEDTFAAVYHRPVV